MQQQQTESLSPADAEDLARRAYAALAAGNRAGFLELLNPAVEWHEPGLPGLPAPSSGGVYLTPAMVAENVLAGFDQAWDGFTLTADDFVSNGERVVVLGHYTGISRSTGKRLAVPFAHVWQTRMGTLCRVQSFTDTARVLAALGKVPTA